MATVLSTAREIAAGMVREAQPSYICASQPAFVLILATLLIIFRQVCRSLATGLQATVSSEVCSIRSQGT